LFDRKCDLTPCMDEVVSQCTPAEGCDACVAGFTDAGGCSNMAEEPVALLPEGCIVCAEAAWGHCKELAAAACAACKDAVALLDADGCDNLGEELPEACQGCPEVVSSELVSSHCAALEEEQKDCHTTLEGEDCFGHVRWAMTLGMSLHREWYEDLDRSSSFEDFQQMLHKRKPDICKLPPCKKAPATKCHTATLGEECYGHTAWARDVGILLRPETYPESFSNQSSFEDFQAWLHHIHHGSCLSPCDVAQ